MSVWVVSCGHIIWRGYTTGANRSGRTPVERGRCDARFTYTTRSTDLTVIHTPHDTIQGEMSLLRADYSITGPSSGFQERFARVHMGDASVAGTGSQLRRGQKNEHPARVTDN